MKQEKRLTKRKKNIFNYTMLLKAKTFITMPKGVLAAMDGALIIVGQNNIQKRPTKSGKTAEKDYKNGEKKTQNNTMKNVLNLF